MPEAISQKELDKLNVVAKLVPGANDDRNFVQSWRRICDIIDGSERRNRIMKLIQEALAQLRLDVKYLQFDLEATKRERDRLKERLEQYGDGDL